MAIPTARPFRMLWAGALAAALLLVSGCAGGDDGVDGAAESSTAAAASTTPGTPHTTAPATSGGQEPESSPPSATAAPSASAEAELAENFPELLKPIIEDSTIEVSTVETADDVTTVSLVASSSASQEEILNHFSGLLTEEGFEALGPDSIEGTASQTFSRTDGQETVTISAVQGEDGTTYSLGAHLLSESLK